MKFDIDILTGKVTIETTLSELDLLGLLTVYAPEPAGPVLPKVFTYYVGKYTQVYVAGDDLGHQFWVCSCDDFRYRRQSPPGEPAYANGRCKHLVSAQVGAWASQGV